MKKIVVLMLTFCMLLGLVACSESSAGKTPPDWLIGSWDTTFSDPKGTVTKYGENFYTIEKDKITVGNDSSATKVVYWSSDGSRGTVITTSNDSQCIVSTDTGSNRADTVFTKTGGDTATYQMIVYNEGTVTEGTKAYLFRHGTV